MSTRLYVTLQPKTVFAEPLCDSESIAQIRSKTSLWRLHNVGPHIKTHYRKNPFGNKPFMKGIILKTVIKKPKKPNSANRKCVVVKLSNGKEMTAYVPGIGHNLQEHNIVLCRVGRLRDTPGVNIKCVRGKYDLPHVAKRE
ncbi:40S ribosomal protein S12, mitochondrial [Harpegnathos saltator]|uniref:Small ribosomal subunit protein uS12m n=1 Tax=Harpegnathos saltator TaxID=610380 RepID=E2BH45_HARSA|nr:40S ribosomal protein S12, mitochondrial [Harpegnathos saltator]